MTTLDIRCNGCGKSPEEIGEYVVAAAEENGFNLDTGSTKTITATEYMQEEEGTYNPENGHFLCTACYIRAGMPTAPGGWRAP